MREKVRMECLECGKSFNKTIGPRTLEVKCPKCGSYDTDMERVSGGMSYGVGSGDELSIRRRMAHKYGG